MKRKFSFKKALTRKVSPTAMFIGCLVVCLIVIGSVAIASNDSINVNSGGVLNLYNQSAQTDTTSNSDMVGAVATPGNLLAENYDSYVMYNGGFNTAKPMVLQGTLSVTGTTTMSGELQAQKVIQGGTVAASSTTKNLTLTAAEICDDAVIAKSIGVNPGTAITVTLPATSTLAADCLDTIGDTVSFLYSNDSTKVASTTTITTNTDYDMLSDDANGDVIAGLDSAIITITREATKMIATINPFTSAE